MANSHSVTGGEAQQLTGHLGVKRCFGAGRESGTKSRQTLNTRNDLKITRVKSSGAESHLTLRKGARKTILVNAIRTGCLSQQSDLPMLLSAAEELKGSVFECRDQERGSRARVLYKILK
ncbi:hypothetical protein HAX54_016427 [Datura stramonium]|uniref:Uncharacterized protein n=1 Tax=Datura stramonium TaxID=4076 RepID=A0ABS8UL39_DATST|nr:hypothetical protein [Datura stramonium]